MIDDAAVLSISFYYDCDQFCPLSPLHKQPPGRLRHEAGNQEKQKKQNAGGNFDWNIQDAADDDRSSISISGGNRLKIQVPSDYD